jgi:hypothetical protein
MLKEDGRQIKHWNAFRRRTAQTRKTVGLRIFLAGRASGRHCCTGLKTAARYGRSTTVDDVVALPTNPMN